MWGLGDYLRGILTSAEECNQRGIQWELEYSYHPMSLFLENAHNTPDSYTPDDVYTFTIGQSKEYFSVLDQLRGISDGVFYVTTNAWFLKNGIQSTTFQKVRESIQPNSILQSAIQAAMNQLGIRDKEYRAIHIRMGDAYLVEDSQNQESFDTICTTIETMIAEQKKTGPCVVFSDSKRIKDFFRTKTGYCVSPASPGHLGFATEDQAVLETLVDFFLLSKASHIFQYSNHGYGTGFSDWCSEIYHVPISRHIVKDTFYDDIRQE